MQSFVDYYSLFNVLQSASIEEIYKKYKKLALVYHPDKYEDASIFIMLQNGLEILKNDRNSYDIKYGKYIKEERERRKQDRAFVALKTQMELDEINEQRNVVNLNSFEHQVFTELQQVYENSTRK